MLATAGVQRGPLLIDRCQAGIVGRRLGSGRLLFLLLCRLSRRSRLGKLVAMLGVSLLLIRSRLRGMQLLLRLQ